MNIRKLACGVVCIAAMFAVVRSEASSFLDGLATNANKIAAPDYASGGDIIWRIGNDYIHIFTNTAASATFTPAEAMSVRVLMVGGGGGGGTNCGGGGGAGGMVETNGLELAANTAYTVTVGAGAAAKSGGNFKGDNGGDSTFKQGETIIVETAVGGGGGGSFNNIAPASGGSGGGAQSGNGAAGVAGQGNKGGAKFPELETLEYNAWEAVPTWEQDAEGAYIYLRPDTRYTPEHRDMMLRKGKAIEDLAEWIG